MPDDVDRAAVVAEGWLGRALERQRAKADSVPLPRELLGLCRDCGDAIQPERLALVPQARRCVACQSEADRRAERGLGRP